MSMGRSGYPIWARSFFPGGIRHPRKEVDAQIHEDGRALRDESSATGAGGKDVGKSGSLLHFPLQLLIFPASGLKRISPFKMLSTEAFGRFHFEVL